MECTLRYKHPSDIRTSINTRHSLVGYFYSINVMEIAELICSYLSLSIGSEQCQEKYKLARNEEQPENFTKKRRQTKLSSFLVLIFSFVFSLYIELNKTVPFIVQAKPIKTNVSTMKCSEILCRSAMLMIYLPHLLWREE